MSCADLLIRPPTFLTLPPLTKFTKILDTSANLKKKQLAQWSNLGILNKAQADRLRAQLLIYNINVFICFPNMFLWQAKEEKMQNENSAIYQLESRYLSVIISFVILIHSTQITDLQRIEEKN